MKKSFLIIAAALTFTGCNIYEYQNKRMTGADRDRHGCIASAGYTWSEVRKDCIRIFEEGIQLIPTNGRISSAAYVVFSHNRNSAELFLPGAKKHPVLKRKGNVWKNNKYVLSMKGNGWILKTGGKDVYVSYRR